MLWFCLGLACGILLTIPLAAMMARRATRRVRRIEQRVLATERLAELGTLTGGLAHEIKNPLSTVGLNLQLIQEDFSHLAADLGPMQFESERLGRIKRRFESLGRETERLRDILEDFLQFAGRLKLNREPADVNALLEELADFFNPQAQAAGVRLRTKLTDPRAKASVDTRLLKQAMLNLMINACQAMADARKTHEPSGGNDELIIRTEHARAFANRSELRIHVIDTGPGIERQTREKIFQPYFSNKKNGTGLGLPTARRIIEEHSGTIVVHSELGRGSDFVITLPLDV